MMLLDAFVQIMLLLTGIDTLSTFLNAPKWWQNYLNSLNEIDPYAISIKVYISYCRDIIFCIIIFKFSCLFSNYLPLK